jgi:hypothetical protein
MSLFMGNLALREVVFGGELPSARRSSSRSKKAVEGSGFGVAGESATARAYGLA